MTRLRRTRYLAFTCQDERVVDVAELLRGIARAGSEPVIYAISILRGEEIALTRAELDFVLSVPSDRWVQDDGADPVVVERVTRDGLVLSDADATALAELRGRDKALENGQWNLYAALLHFPTRWRDIDLALGPPELAEADELPPALSDATEAFVEQYGDPPPPFHRVEDALAVHELPFVERHGGLYDALTRRKTTRRWDRSATIGAEELATVLYYVFGCHGNAPMAGGSLILKRTSPSGGGLHPIEAYPLVSGVDGIDPGLYHYNGQHHSLELIAAVDSDEATEIAAQFVCGQRFLASAHVLVAMTARFYRSFWKYRRHQKAYSALMMDAAHLSQTLYLVATDMGLGAFVTAAINGANIEERLKLDGFNEGAVAVAGFGKRSSRPSPLEPRYAPHVPAAPT